MAQDRSGDAFALWAISPLDGRYGDRLSGLGSLVSEGGLVSYRIQVEAAWLLHLAEIPAVAATLRPRGLRR